MTLSQKNKNENKKKNNYIKFKACAYTVSTTVSTIYIIHVGRDT